MKVAPKKIVFFIHTDWCKYCFKMKETTLKNKHVIQLLNDHFYYISLNAEQKENITFNQQQFKYIPNSTHSGVHELAKALGTINQKISYPTLSILNSSYEIIFQYNQYLEANQLQEILEEI